jgi:hypothetical protein
MIDIRGKNVYLSGPMTGRYCYNVGTFAIAHAKLKELKVGYVFNPAIRYLVMGAEKLKDMEHGDFMLDTIHELTMREKRDRRDDEWVRTIPRKYDMVVMLPGWEDSDGARKEREVALSCDIPVYELDDVLG